MKGKKRKLKELAFIERPRERFIQKGPDALTNRELLALVLQFGSHKGDVFALADQIWRRFPGRSLIEADHAELTKISGMGASKALTLLAAIRLTERILGLRSEGVPDRVTIKSSQDAFWAAYEIGNYKKEHLIGLYLNARFELIQKEIIAIGSLNSTQIHPREVFAPSFTETYALILVHNHPSGNPQPSSSDLEVTRKLKRAGQILGIRVLDHLVIAGSRYVSLKQIKAV